MTKRCAKCGRRNVLDDKSDSPVWCLRHGWTEGYDPEADDA